MEAYDLPGSSAPRQEAIKLGTPRKFSYLIDQAMSLSEDGDSEGAGALLRKVPDGHPLLPVARARLAGDAPEVVNAISTAQLHKDEDADLALHSTVMLVWAYGILERFDLATDVLREANQRFPDRAWLLFYQAQQTYNAAVVQSGFESPIGRGLLAEASELALRSRDCFRVWNGPSQRAVAFATQMFGLLEDPWEVINVASPKPMGEATTSEVDDPVIKRNLADAKMSLGQYEDIDTVGLQGVDPSERARIQGMKALSLGDEAAVSLMRKALALANNKESRHKAMRVLAMAGQIDEAALSEVTEADAALFRGLASVSRGNMTEAIRILTPYRLESLFHAHCLAEAEHRSGNPDKAITTLIDAAEQFESMLLYAEATKFLMQQGEFEKAEVLAAETLARDPSLMVRHSLMIMLVTTADQLRNWQKMESYARTMSRSFPQDEWAPWMVVYALHHHGKNQHAWGYLVGNDLHPFDDKTALLAIKVYHLADAPDQAERLLQIANTYTDSEQVLGYALTTLMMKRDRIRLDDHQRMLLQESIEEFVKRYPESDILQRHTAPQPEELFKKVGLTTDALKSEFERGRPLLQKVSYGHWPFGVLLWERPDLTYTSVLFTMEGGWLTAISTDSDERETERLAATQAINGRVAVDTSVVVVGTNAELDIERLGEEFESVLVADELIADARVTVARIRQGPDGVVTYDFGLGQNMLTEIDENQRMDATERAQGLLDTLLAWQVVRSGPLQAPVNIGENERHFRPWDASIRVAHSTGSALWCDDMALRRWATSVGIPTFGTWALYEVLSSLPQGDWLPTPREMKKRLLRTRIADVPILFDELTPTMDNNDSLCIATELFLRRSYVWSRTPVKTREWYLKRVNALMESPNRQRIPILFYQACYGWGTAVSNSDQKPVTSDLLARTLLAVKDPEITPVLVAAGRYAANELAEPDPLPESLLQLAGIDPDMGTGLTEETLIRLFSEEGTPTPSSHQ